MRRNFFWGGLSAPPLLKLLEKLLTEKCTHTYSSHIQRTELSGLYDIGI